MRLLAPVCCAGLAFIAMAVEAAGTIRFNGAPAELVISEVSERTVRTHVSHILDKLHLANRTQMALYAVREGIAKLDRN